MYKTEYKIACYIYVREYYKTFMPPRPFELCYLLLDAPYKQKLFNFLQRVFFGFDCFSTDVGMASLVLAIAGVPPQHNSPNRDEYIEILWNNIIPGTFIFFFLVLVNLLNSTQIHDQI